MTLRDFFQSGAEQPVYVLFYFLIVPLTALLTGWLAKGEGDQPPWRYLYSAMLYLVCVPGIFAVSLQVYVFLFERRSIFDMSMLMEVLPVVSMLATILIVRRNVDIDKIPGFDKLSGLVMMISAALAIMWFVDRTHIVVFSFMPFYQVIFIFIALLLVIRLGWSRLVKAPPTR